MAPFAIVLLLPWLLSLLMTPPIIRWANAHGYMDHPTERKAHARPVALLGGVAVFASAGLGLLLAALWSEPVWAGLHGSPSLLALGAGCAAMVALGLYDDLRDMRPLAKLAFQVVIAAVTWQMGFRIVTLELPFGWMVADAALPSLILTTCWIVAVTNAFNLIDGVDGLTTGIGVISGLTIFWVAAAARETVPILGALALTGALCGFLRFNLSPARIILGDAGALAIGYAMAVVSTASYQKGPTAMIIVVPLLAVGLPVLDTILSIVRRGIWHLRSAGVAGLRPGVLTRALFRADRGHLHFLLLRLGWSVRRVVFALYVFSALLALLALWTRQTSSSTRWGVLVAVVIGSIALQRRLEARVNRLESQASAPVEMGAGVSADAARRRGGGSA